MFLGGLVAFGVGEYLRKKKEEEKRMIAQQKVYELISDIEVQSNQSVKEAIDRYMLEINQQIEQSLHTERQTIEKALQDVRQLQHLKKEEQEQVTQELTVDLQRVKELQDGI
jgi:hypothetical protein